MVDNMSSLGNGSSGTSSSGEPPSAERRAPDERQPPGTDAAPPALWVVPETDPPPTARSAAAERRAASRVRILVVDDSRTARSFLSKVTGRYLGNPIVEAGTAEQALEILEDGDIGTVILDHNLPGMDGLGFLKVKNAVADWKDIPVLVMTAEDYDEALVEAYLGLGAADFLPKRNFHALVFAARVRRCLQLHDAVRARQNLIDDLSRLQARQEDLLKSTLPARVYREILEHGFSRPVTPQRAAVLFADVCDFTSFASTHSSARLVTNLNRMVMRFERICGEFHLAKIKTIGDAFMAGAGLFGESFRLEDVVAAGLAMIREANALDIGWSLKVGIAVGPLVGGVIGAERVQFDVWGNTVNLAARLCSASAPNRLALPEGEVRDLDTARLGTGGMTVETATRDLKGIGPTGIAFLAPPLAAVA
jgi:adenylate cyclase